MRQSLLIGPVAFTLIGAAVGVCWAMLFRQDVSEWARVSMHESTPCLLLGTLGGFGCGIAVHKLLERRPGALWATKVVATTLLGAAILAPIGWIAGDSVRDRMPRKGLLLGALAGAGIGVLAGLGELRSVRRRRSRLANECAKLVPAEEQQMAEEGLGGKVGY